MTREEIIHMAREAGISGPSPARHGFKMYANPQRLERFAGLVAAAEREACAKVAEGFEANRDWVPGSLWGNLRAEVAAAIRARGQA